MEHAKKKTHTHVADPL